MKSLNLYFVLISILCFVSCSPAKKITKSLPNNMGQEIEITMPIKSEYSVDTKDALRNVSNGVSPDWNVAKNIANINCRSGLALKINGKIKTAIERYVRQYSNVYDKNVEIELNTSYEEYDIMYSESNLININELQSYTTINSNTHYYTYWVAMEIKKSDIINEVTKKFDKLPKKIKDEINYNRDKFVEYLNNNIF